MIRLDIGSASLVGQVRAANEDSLLAADGLAVVADGMGGHRGGAVASADAVGALAEVEGSRSLDDLVRTVHWANRQISERADVDPELRGMGTTVCVVGLIRRDDADEVAVLNVGDSRVYLLAAGEMNQLTEDHSLVESLVREGQITEQEALTHPQRNVLTRALGVEPLVTVDAWLLSPRDGDRLLLCSDGLTNELDDERIAELLAEGEPADVTARRLAAEADAAGGRDNTTAVVVDVVGSGADAAALGDRFRKITTPAVDLSEEDLGPHTETVMAVIASPDAQADSDPQTDPPPEELQGDEGIAALATGESEELIAAQAAADAAASRAARWRTAAFVVAIFGVIALAVGAIFFTAGRGWYVGEDDDGYVALYRGTPVLWLQPEYVKSSDKLVADLTPAAQSKVEEGLTFSDEADAIARIDSLTVTTTTTTTTTTTPAMTTTTTTVPVMAPAGAPAAPATG